MKKILILFAQHAEAEGTIRRLRAEAVAGQFAEVWSEGRIPSLYQFSKGEIAISSVGLHAAQMTAAHRGMSCDEIWNLGLAGALTERHSIGTLLPIGTVGKFVPIEEERLDKGSLECLSSILPHLSIDGSSGRLVSSDFPIHDADHRKRLGENWDLVDMEGYGIAFAAAHLNKKCRMWKIVSDFASPGGREMIRKHKVQLSESIADTIEGML